MLIGATTLRSRDGGMRQAWHVVKMAVRQFALRSGIGSKDCVSRTSQAATRDGRQSATPSQVGTGPCTQTET